MIVFPQKAVKTEATFYIFANLLRMRLRRRQLDSHICFSTLNMLQYILLVTVYEKKSNLTQIYNWERKDYVNSLSDNCGYAF